MRRDRKSTRLNSSHANISYAVFCLKKTQYRNASDRRRVPCRRPPVVRLVRLLFFYIPRPPPTPTLFPYTTLFRSVRSTNPASPMSVEGWSMTSFTIRPLTDHTGSEVIGLDFTGAIDNEARSEEHTSELQSRQYLVCRLLLEKNTISKRVRSPTGPLSETPGGSPCAPSFLLHTPATTDSYTLSLHDALPICPFHESCEPNVG